MSWQDLRNDERLKFVAGTTLGKETPESRDKSRPGKDVVQSLALERGGSR